MLEGHAYPSRLISARVAIPECEHRIRACVYFETRTDLTATNLGLLSNLAALREDFSLPILARGGYDVPPERPLRLDYVGRAGFDMIAPESYTICAKTRKTKIDNFIASIAVAMQMGKVKCTMPFLSRLTARCQ